MSGVNVPAIIILRNRNEAEPPPNHPHHIPNHSDGIIFIPSLQAFKMESLRHRQRSYHHAVAVDIESQPRRPRSPCYVVAVAVSAAAGEEVKAVGSRV